MPTYGHTRPFLAQARQLPTGEGGETVCWPPPSLAHLPQLPGQALSPIADGGRTLVKEAQKSSFPTVDHRLSLAPRAGGPYGTGSRLGGMEEGQGGEGAT